MLRTTSVNISNTTGTQTSAGRMPLQPLEFYFFVLRCLSASFQCFDAVVWAAGRASGLQKTEWWGAAVAICLERGADLHMAQLMPLTFSCFSKVQTGFTSLLPAHPGSTGQRAVKRVCVCVCVLFVCCSEVATTTNRLAAGGETEEKRSAGRRGKSSLEGCQSHWCVAFKKNAAFLNILIGL